MNQKPSVKFFLPIILSLFILVPFIAIGMPFRVALLPDKGANFSCGTCHVDPAGGGPRNPFGQDWEKIAIPAGDKYVDALANIDSDGDGFTNDEEFDAKTNPGDPNSKPDNLSQ